MASMRDIKRRKSSITSTQQITKAMKLVSTVKLQKARAHAEATDPYFNYMYRTVSSMLAKSGNLEHPYLKAGDSPRKVLNISSVSTPAKKPCGVAVKITSAKSGSGG